MSERSKQALRELGLTPYEVSAYVSLLEGGILSATEISKMSGIPLTRVYDVLGSLESRGFVHKAEQGRPVKYSPISPSSALNALILSAEERLKKSKHLVLEELQPLYEKSGEAERHDVLIIHGENNILARGIEMLEHAEKFVLLTAPVMPKKYLEHIKPIFSRLREKNVDILVLAGEKVLENDLKDGARVVLKEGLFGGGIIIDGREVMILLSGPKSGEEGMIGIWSDHIGLASFAQEYFYFLWDSVRKEEEKEN
ncbi:MAG: TrmB family transcriptional regulator [Asgard group archaeon]